MTQTIASPIFALSASGEARVFMNIVGLIILVICQLVNRHNEKQRKLKRDAKKKHDASTK
jgi:hypothetical protein